MQNFGVVMAILSIFGLPLMLFAIVMIKPEWLNFISE